MPMFTKTGLTAIALIIGATKFAASAPADARNNGSHGLSNRRVGSLVGTRFGGRKEIMVPASELSPRRRRISY